MRNTLPEFSVGHSFLESLSLNSNADHREGGCPGGDEGGVSGVAADVDGGAADDDDAAVDRGAGDRFDARRP